MTTILQKKMQKMHSEYFCENCNFITSNKYNFDKHKSTAKHLHTTKYKTFTTKIQEKVCSDVKYVCECGKIYPYRASLFNHKKKCNLKVNTNDEMISGNNNTNSIITSNDISKDLILKLVEENGEIKKLLFKQFETMQSQMQDQQKMMHSQINELIPRVGNNNNTINNKQKFNINIFLNEQCKDAITMEEFINKIEVTLGNLLVTKDKGLCEGVSNIFIENMQKLSLYERPMHCTDSKRETIYIKCEDEDGGNGGVARWQKDEENKRLKHALNKVTHIQRKNLDMWVDKHPNWENISHQQDEYMMLVRNCTEDIKENNKENKIIKKVCNQIRIGNGGEIL